MSPHSVVLGVSTDSKFSHFAWASQPRKQGGLGPDLKLPLLADRSMSISRDYGVLIEEEGIALRGLFIIDPKGTLRYVSPRSSFSDKLFADCLAGRSPSTTSPSAAPSRRPSVS